MGQKENITAPEYRCDRAQLRKPRVLDDGTKIYEAQLAVAGRPLEYPWGTEIPTKEALSNPKYIEGLRGISIIAHHPPKQKIVGGRAPKEGEGRRIGSNISARFDDATSAVVIEMAIPEAEDQKIIESQLRQVSEGYTPTLQRNDDGKIYQTDRTTNHIAVTWEGRADDAFIRTDAKLGGSVDLEKMMARLEELMTEVSDMKAKLADMGSAKDAAVSDAAAARVDSAKANAIVDAFVKELGEEARNDASKVSALLQARYQAEGLLLSELKSKANALKVTLPDTAVDAKSIRKHLAVSLGADAARCDSADFCDGLIEAAVKKAPEKAEIRNDSNTYPL